MPSHSKQIINSSHNKPTSSVIKAKPKNKRRNRKKKKQKVQIPIHEMRKMTSNSVNSAYNATDEDVNFKQNQSHMPVAQMWAKTYETMIRLQYQHRIQYWKNLAISRDAEIHKLKEKLQANCTNYDVAESACESETSAKCSSQTKREESEESDESYLKFLEITLRHRQQRKRNRENETDSK